MATARWLTGDVFEVLATLPDQSVHSVITSPPYWRKRRYLPEDHPDAAKEIGREPSPGEFLATLLRVTDELWRVVRDDGTIWFNLGDTAAGSGGAGGDYNEGGLRAGQPKWKGTGKASWKGSADYPIAKSVCWIPELFGASLAYGRNLLTGEPCRQWITRPPVTWCKPAPTPGEIIDKFREATELFVWAAKQPRYYFDLDAVRLPPMPENERTAWNQNGPKALAARAAGKDVSGHERNTKRTTNPKGAPPLNWWKIDTSSYNGWASTARRVPCGPDDGGKRTTSPGCPMHGDQAGPAPTVRDGARAGPSPNRTQRNDADREQEPLFAAETNDLTPDCSGSIPDRSSRPSGPQRSPAAKPHSTAGHRTGPAPSTSRPCTPSDETNGRTGHTPASPASVELHPDTHENTPSVDDSPDSPTTRTADHTAGTDIERVSSAACSCSFHRVIEEPTSHFATFPPELILRPVIASCPPGGTILDCFGGSGTTAMVATGNSRNCVSIDFDERNADLARQRVGMFLDVDDGWQDSPVEDVATGGGL